MSQVRELPRIIIDRIALFLEPLTSSDETINSSEDKEVKALNDATDNEKIKKLKEMVVTVNIPLEDVEQSVVKKQRVNEREAQRRADEIKQQTDRQQTDGQKTIE